MASRLRGNDKVGIDAHAERMNNKTGAHQCLVFFNAQ